MDFKLILKVLIPAAVLFILVISSTSRYKEKIVSPKKYACTSSRYVDCSTTKNAIVE